MSSDATRKQLHIEYAEAGIGRRYWERKLIEFGARGKEISDQILESNEFKKGLRLGMGMYFYGDDSYDLAVMTVKGAISLGAKGQVLSTIRLLQQLQDDDNKLFTSDCLLITSFCGENFGKEPVFTGYQRMLIESFLRERADSNLATFYQSERPYKEYKDWWSQSILKLVANTTKLISAGK